MRETISDVDKEIEQKDNNLLFLKDKIGLPDSKVTEEMNRLGLNKVSSKEKINRVVNKYKKTLSNHKYIKN